MPQVQLNTRVDVDTYNQLKEASRSTGKSIAAIVDEALNQYFKEASPMYEKNGEWSGYTITKSDKGFVVTFWSRIQGTTDGDKYLYQFDKDFTPETDLNAPWNDTMTYGEYLGQTIREQYKQAKENGYKTNIKCLVKGQEVR
jgi:hypothetical protein